MTRLAVGSKAPPLSLVTIQSKKIAIPDLTAPLVHLQFRRFAGCPDRQSTLTFGGPAPW